jgi:hypothetical protein
MAFKSIPTNGQTNWGTALNSHIGQLMNPEIGGFNIVADDAGRDARYPNPGVEGIGLTVFNRKVNQFQVWTSNPVSPSNGMWMDLNGTTEVGPGKPGQGVVNLRTDGYLEILNAANGTPVDIRQLGIGIGTIIDVSEMKQSIKYMSSDGKRFLFYKEKIDWWYSGFVTSPLNITAPVEVKINEPFVYAMSGTNFTSSNIDIKVGDWISIASIAAGVVTNVTSDKLLLDSTYLNSSGNFSSSATQTGFSLRKIADSRNRNYTFFISPFSLLADNSNLFIDNKNNINTDGNVTGRSFTSNDLTTKNDTSITNTSYTSNLLNTRLESSSVNRLIQFNNRSRLDSASVIDVLINHWSEVLINQSSTVPNVHNIRSELRVSNSTIQDYRGLWVVGVGSGNIERYYGIFETSETTFNSTIQMNYFRTRSSFGGDSGVQPKTQLSVRGLPVHADNAAAIAAGLNGGDFYRKADGTVMVRF